MAQEMGFHPSTLSKILGGTRKISLDRAQHAASLVGIDPAYFLPTRTDPSPADFDVAENIGRASTEAMTTWTIGVDITQLHASVDALAKKRIRGEDTEADWNLLAETIRALRVVRDSEQLATMGEWQRDLFLFSVLNDFIAVNVDVDEAVRITSALIRHAKQAADRR